MHQDGFDHIAIVGIGRHNIEGGEILLYQDCHDDPFFRKVLGNGEVAMLADNKLWHNARPIRSLSGNEQGYMDLFVLTAKAVIMSFTPDQARVQFSALNQRIRQTCGVPRWPGGSQVPQSVLEKMTAYLGHYNSNLGGHYFSSQITTDLMQQAREHAQALLNAESSGNIIFGANMTSLTFSLSRAISRDWQVGDEVIVTALDHYSNVSSWQQAAEDKGRLCIRRASIL